MAIDVRDPGVRTRGTASREDPLSKLFTRATTLAFLIIAGTVTAIALGYTPLFSR
jgi:hypothetical protein